MIRTTDAWEVETRDRFVLVCTCDIEPGGHYRQETENIEDIDGVASAHEASVTAAAAGWVMAVPKGLARQKD